MPSASRPDCPWCSAPMRDGERLRGRIGCRVCGTATTDPWPSPTALEAAYADWYRPDAGRFSGVGDRLLRRTRGSLSRRIDRIAPPGPILDVGAGDGALLTALRARGREAVGLERAPSRPGMRDGEVAEQEQGSWAAVILWHSLEHLPEPGRAVEAIGALLLPGGVAVIAIPNSASIQAKAFGDHWLALDLPRHLIHLTAASLLRKLRSAGLTVERVSYLRGGQVIFGWLHGLVRMLPGHPSLYDAIRRPAARSEPVDAPQRFIALAAAVFLLLPATLAGLAEAALGRGGTVYVEARRA